MIPKEVIRERPDFQLMFHEPGDEAPEMLPGDAILTSGTAAISRFIQVAQLLRYVPYFAKEEKLGWKAGIKRAWEFCKSNHLALAADTNGAISEALWFGVQLSDIERYRNYHYVVIHPLCSAEDREQMEHYIWSVLYAKHSYGYITIFSIFLQLLAESYVALAVGLAAAALMVYQDSWGLGVSVAILAALVTRLGFYFSVPNSDICSAHGAECHRTIGTIFKRPTTHVAPADFRWRYNVDERR